MRRRRTLRHPLRGERLYARPAPQRSSRGSGQHKVRLPRMRPRRSVNVAALVSAPEELPARPWIRVRVIGVVVFALFAVTVLRLWDLQVLNHKKYAAAVNVNATRAVTIPAPRGDIVDRSGTVLVGNAVEDELVLSRAVAHSDPSIVAKVAALVGETPKQVQAALTDQQYSPYEPVPVLQKASPAVVQYIDAHQSQFPGVSVQQVTVRDYPQGGTLANQVLGYVGPINGTELKAVQRSDPTAGYNQSSEIGKAGVESQYEQYLRGKSGTQTLEVNAVGTVVGVAHTTQPTQGDTLLLNITGGLQKAVQQDLANVITLDRHSVTNGHTPKATNGAAVVLDAQTGAVLALASYPGYSLTTWVGGISTAAYDNLTKNCNVTTGDCPLNDYAIQGLFTPGSTFKLSTATAALQDGIITPYSTVDDTGTYTLRKHGIPTCTGKCSFHDATAADAGVVNVSQALTRSDDYFFYTMGIRFYLQGTNPAIGPDGIQKVANAYGFGSTTGIDLPGEVTGRVDSKTVRAQLHKATPKAFPNTYWYPATNLEMAFGQGGTVITPIEEAQAYATFADHGVKHQPEVAAGVVSPDGKVVESIAPKVTGHVTVSPANYTAMLQGFIGVTHTPTGTAYGTFKQYSHVPSSYVIAGKTGTATTATSTTTRLPNAWFVGFGPVGGTPQFVVVCEVSQGGFGDAAAAPAVANIFNYLYTNPPPAPAAPASVTHLSAAMPAANPPAGTQTTTTTTAPPTTTTTAPTTTAPTTTAPPTTTTTAPARAAALPTTKTTAALAAAAVESRRSRASRAPP